MAKKHEEPEKNEKEPAAPEAAKQAEAPKQPEGSKQKGESKQPMRWSRPRPRRRRSTISFCGWLQNMTTSASARSAKRTASIRMPLPIR